jgi:hypothetical protein
MIKRLCLYVAKYPVVLVGKFTAGRLDWELWIYLIMAKHFVTAWKKKQQSFSCLNEMHESVVNNELWDYPRIIEQSNLNGNPVSAKLWLMLFR